ncbi:MAG TPA: magnesium transporter CorA family protein [Phycisphaerae bacterium]|nr:magnesium transporter CorA family protein [Phycisphaerales bacterium]HRX84295.1 magnesium transporter CorA family protein [Phycisphaerae bacterium]
MNSFADLARAYAVPDSIAWVDLESPTEQDLADINRIIPLDDDARVDCLEGAQRPRIDEFEDCLFLVLYGMRGTDLEDCDDIHPRKLAAFFSPRFLVTIHRQVMPSVSEERERARKHPEQYLAEGPDDVLYRIVHRMVDRFMNVAEWYETAIEVLEDRSLADDVDRKLLGEASDLRSAVLEMRHLAVAQRELIRPLADGDFDYIECDLRPHFSHVADELSQVVELIDSLREQIAGVRDNYRTSIAQRTNDIMQTLTIFATIMLPMSLVAGIYGMNLPIWPSPERPASFWVVLGVMGAIAVVMLTFFRRKRWL